jgi:hypothetical protein
MESGYVLDFSDRTFGEFVEETVEIDIHSDRYTTHGTSKAKKLRTFWTIESDYLTSTLLSALIDYALSPDTKPSEEQKALGKRSREIAARLLAGSPSLADLKVHARNFDSKHLAEQIRRLEASVEKDPELAIGTAKELLETCCKTILEERGRPITGTPDVPTLTKATLRELKLVPEGVSEAARGADTVRRLLSNLGTIGHTLAELRGLYGTGHGKHGKAAGLQTRHAKLAVGACSTLARFLFETHKANE